jgi:hypothetical protein
VAITRRSGIAEVAAAVAGALAQHGVHAVLTGGACAMLYSDGRYQSHDLDFILPVGSTRRSMDEAMVSGGFVREGDRYVNPHTEFFVEFPRGPLAIGDDLDVRPIRLNLSGGYSVGAGPEPTHRCGARVPRPSAESQSRTSPIARARRNRRIGQIRNGPSLSSTDPV